MKIVIVATSGESLLNFRAKMIQEWIRLGNEVVCISIEPNEEIGTDIRSLGANYYQVAGDRTGISIGSGFAMIKNYENAFRELKPDLVFLYMSKPIAYGGIAAIRCKVPRLFIFQTGLEIAFYGKGFKNFVIRTILKTLYKYVQSHAETVLFMSKQDEEKMLKWKLVKREQVDYVDGSGVDMTHFVKTPMPDESVVCMTARLVWSKGIREYIEAAKIVKQKMPESNIHFLLLGGLDSNSESLSKQELDELVKQGIIEYCGYQKDVLPYLQKCSVFVLPSYHEGKGKSILEAQAVGRPIITTDAPGCSETVVDGYNGFIVPVRNAEMIAEKIIKLTEDRILRDQMAENAYQYCKEKFDVNIINRHIMKRMKLI